ADEVENPSVLHSIISQALDASVLVEIDRDDPLVHYLLRQKRGFFGALGNIIEHLAVDRRDGRRRAEHDQNLLLGRAERNLLEGAFLDYVPMVIGLRETAGERQCGGNRDRDSDQATSASSRVEAAHVPRCPLVRELVTYPAGFPIPTQRKPFPRHRDAPRRRPCAATIGALCGAIVARARPAWTHAPPIAGMGGAGAISSPRHHIP